MTIAGWCTIRILILDSKTTTKVVPKVYIWVHCLELLFAITIDLANLTPAETFPIAKAIVPWEALFSLSYFSSSNNDVHY